MDTPNVTPVQYGAGGIFLAVALGCLNAGITGADLIAYLASAAIVSASLVYSDARIRNGRAAMIGAEYQGAGANRAVFGGNDDEDEA